MLERQISLEGLEHLRGFKCLLAFSGGLDSVALFYLLLEKNIMFDIAIVHHGLRAQADQEVAYARKLASEHAKQVYVHYVKLQGANVEACARACRHEFFAQLATHYDYKCVLLAHHLNDKLEWLLMQLAKGASLQTLLGFNLLESRETAGYTYYLVRPLLYTPKSTLEHFVHTKGYTYFHDISNDMQYFRRNAFRHGLSNAFLAIAGFSAGVRRSFKWLEQEKNALYPPISSFYIVGTYIFLALESRQQIYHVDQFLKKLGYVLSTKQRLELVRQRFNAHFSTQAKIYCVGALQGFVFVGSMPHVAQQLTLPKAYKEQCRLLKIPKTMRHALYSSKWQENLKTIEHAKLTLCVPSS
ncbi:tRNA lysidine(34) synthetase TilS [Helicobacter baculiformis]|uniref:tRNA(Ile)-lysidine synthase n=1 Tax=Helicobacter baculiformis TaxID=427351 RepID=A0ABV7ZKV0_9HELI|nr:tRNA lysidine(34) synthetase TilS [Helicobacter baculiformis]